MRPQANSKNRESAQSILPENRKMDQLCGSFRRKRRGASTVEFAIVAPVFILLVFGMIEYGRMVMVQQVITNATREGARRFVLRTGTVSEAQNAVTNYLNGAGVNGSAPGIVVSATPPAPESGTDCTVSMQIRYSEVSWIPAPFFLGNATLTASSTMRRE
ncbi:MAG: Flp pilus assembly protein TadG [Pirellulaceae bacterium]|jgi:Flp pilus assembly protein TadG